MPRGLKREKTLDFEKLTHIMYVQFNIELINKFRVVRIVLRGGIFQERKR